MSIENKSKRGDYILYMLVTVVGVIICSSHNDSIWHDPNIV